MTVEEALYDSMRIMSIPSLKPKQREAIIAFVDGNDVFVSLPTGYGKSGSTVLCISPLLSIMIDQSEKYKNNHFSVEFVGEAQSDAACNRVVNGKIQLVCISPESLLENRW